MRSAADHRTSTGKDGSVALITADPSASTGGAETGQDGAPARRSNVRRWRVPPRATTIFLLLLGATAIEALARFDIVNDWTLIPFTSMVAGAWDLLMDENFRSEAIIPTTTAILISFALSAVLGVICGWLLWRVDILGRALDPYISVYYAVPTFALYPVLVAIVGTGTVPIVIVATAFASVAVIIQTVAGLNSIPRIYDKLGSVLGLASLRRLRYISFPAALPSIFAGLKLALVYSIVSVVATEFILSPTGVGHYIALAYNSFDLERMYGGILLVLVLSLVLSSIMSAIGKRLLRGFQA